MPRPRKIFEEVGRSGYKFNYGVISEEFLTTLQGQTGRKTFAEMRENDPIIGACMHAITQILREARWDVREVEGGKAEDVEFLKENMSTMEHSWGDFISNVLNMLTYGFAIFEQVYTRNEADKIVWRKIAYRNPLTIERWELDDNGDLLGVYQRAAPDYREVYIPIEKCLHFKTESAGNNPEGRSILRNAFRPWYFKKTIEELEAIGIERDMTGFPIVTPPEGFDMDSSDSETAAELAELKRTITAIRRDELEGMIKPYGWTVELLGSPGERQFSTVETINRYNKEIAVTVLAQFVMLGMERTGSYALAKEQTDMFYMCLESWEDSIGKVLNMVAVPRLFALNGVTNRPLPQIVHTPIHKVNLRDLSAYVSDLTKVDALEIDDGIKKLLARYARLTEFSETRL